METVFQLTRSELAATIHAVLDEREKHRKSVLKTISIHQAAKRLGRADATIKKLVDKGLIPITPDGRIPESSLEEFINQAFE